MNSSHSNRRRKSSNNGPYYYGKNRSRKRRRKDPLPLILGAAVIAVLLIIVLFVLKRSSSDRNDHQSTEASTEETLPTGIIRHNAEIDLGAILPADAAEDDKILNIKGMTPQEIKDEIASRYKWTMCVVNGKADVGSTVKQTVDANATTEAATMGDADNPDGINKPAAETESDEISVQEKVEVPDLVAAALPAFLEQIQTADDKISAETSEAETPSEAETKKKSLFSKKETESETDIEADSEPVETYVFAFEDTDAVIEDVVKKASSMWYVEPHGGSIGSYDKSSDKFVMEGAKSGYKVDEDKLASDIRSAIDNKDFTKAINVPGEVLSAESKITVGDYRILASYTTNTTSNPVRNKNIELACNALNGTIVRPGEEFSFNNTVGQRTEAKGYGAAAAYNNGEVVQEVGGGVCQVSTTLYNAVLKAGLKITARQSHTFKPTYVTPGQDATVSWGGPDFRFANIPAISEYSNSESYAIGIRASYYKQTVTVSIYGRPVLKDGYSYSLSSEQIKELDLVRELIQPGGDKTPTKGSKGSVWETKLIIKKGDQVVSDKVDHKAYYAGHKEYYYDETTAPDQSESASESESSGSASESTSADGPGGHTGQNGSGIIGPGETVADTTASGEFQGPPAGGGSSSEPGAPGNGISEDPGQPTNN